MVLFDSYQLSNSTNNFIHIYASSWLYFPLWKTVILCPSWTKCFSIFTTNKKSQSQAVPLRSSITLLVSIAVPAHSRGVRLQCGHLKITFIITYGQKGMNAAGDGSWSIEWKWHNHTDELEPGLSMKIKALKRQSPFFMYDTVLLLKTSQIFWTWGLDGTWSEGLLHENYLW